MGTQFTSIHSFACIVFGAAILLGMAHPGPAHAQQAGGIELACSIDDTVTVTGGTVPLTLTVRVRNGFGQTLTEAQLLPLLPPQVLLENGERAVKQIVPDPLPPWQPGTPLPELTWALRYGAWTQFCRDTELSVQVLGTARDSTGMPVSFDCLASFVVRGTDRGLPPLSVTMTGSTPSCDSIVLDAGPGYVRYQWSTGDSTQQIVVRQSGRYWVQTWTDDCYMGIFETRNLAVYPRPAAPVITRNHNTLIAPDGFASYQWLRNGVPIPGESGPRLTVTAPGYYRVVVTNAFGCENSSGEFDVSVLGVREGALSRFEIELYPIPARDGVTVRLPETASDVRRLILYDGLGRVVRSQEVHARQGSPQRMDLRGLSPGVYTLRVHGTDTDAWRLLPVR